MIDPKAVPFTQYVLPDGRKKHEFIDVDPDLAKKAWALIDNGYYFEAEILTTGIVRFTCCFDDEDIAIELSKNGPDVIVAVAKLIETAYEDKIKERDADTKRKE